MNRQTEQWYYPEDYKGYRIEVYVHPDNSCTADVMSQDGEWVSKVDAEDFDTAVACAKHEIDLIGE